MGIFNFDSEIALGPLELEVMDVIWNEPETSVRDVVVRLRRPLAYTTIMTTMDRLYKKGLLDRRKSDRAFLYAPRESREHFESRRASDVLAGFLSAPNPARDLLASYLVDAAEQYDPKFLDALEEKIRRKKAELKG